VGLRLKRRIKFLINLMIILIMMKQHQV